MGADLFDQFSDWTAEADETLGYSIRSLCLDDPDNQLGLTQFTQPALFVVNAMSYRAREAAGGATPAVVAGHSLGEYNALVAAGVFDFGTALRLVKRRGELMGQVTGGGMAAVVGVTPAVIEAVLADSEAGRRLDVANFNSFEQTVIAGRTDDLTEVRAPLKEAGARVIPLKVSAPFHSRYMREPMQAFAADLDAAALEPASVPIVANLTGRPYDPARVRETLGDQIGHSVRWLDSVLFLLEAGVDEFEEVGPGKVLTKLVDQIRTRAQTA